MVFYSQYLRGLGVNIKVGTILLASFVLGGCAPKFSEVPNATNFERSNQRVLQAAHHWTIVNNEVVDQLISQISGKVGKDELIFIVHNNSIYAKHLYKDVVRGLVSAGYAVHRPDSKRTAIRHDKNEIPNHAVLIELNPEVVKFSHGRKQPHDSGYPSAVAGGLWVLKGIGANAYGGATAGVLAYDVYDWFSSQNFSSGTPESEIIVEVMVSKDSKFMALHKSIYFVVDSDGMLYEALSNKNEPIMHEYSVTGGRP